MVYFSKKTEDNFFLDISMINLHSFKYDYNLKLNNVT